MSQTKLRVTASHAADEFQGSFLGIDMALFHWVGLALLTCLGLFSGLFYVSNFGLVEAAGSAAVPPVIVVAYLRFAHQGKPPGFIMDLLDSLITSGHAAPPRKYSPHPVLDV